MELSNNTLIFSFHSASFERVYFVLSHLELSNCILVFLVSVQISYEYIFSCPIINRIVKVHFDFLCLQ